jgi:NADH-quinone oxidoreductase subunit F
VDLHIIGAEATEAERAAVDALLGAPESSWLGGLRDVARDGRAARGGLEEANDRRDLLLPAFHAVQDRVGWVSRGAMNYICSRLTVPPAEAWGVLTFYHLFNTEPAPATVVHVCDDIACRLKGAEKICRDLESTDTAFERSPCLGQCDRAPAALLIAAGERPSAKALVNVTGWRDLAGDHRQTNPAPHVVGSKLLRRAGKVDPTSLEAYRASGGYAALRRAIEIGPPAVIAEVIASNLLGRGGAAFPTGRKWEAVARERAMPHFLVCNADESEPGTFKDRVLLEQDPFAVIEAMTVAGIATGCAQGFIYLRGEYPEARVRVQEAIDSARAAGFLGPNVMRSGAAFDIEIRRGAGAYICGEETALFNSLEGRRGEPRSKPPFPVQVGLFGKPTVVNNVETLVNVLDIVIEGADAWARVGTKQSAGTRLLCVSGHIAKPGLYELPFGQSLGELLDMAGGVAGGRPLQAILLGGAAGTFVGPEALSLKLTFEDVRAAGATLGSGVVMVFDDTADVVDAVVRIAKFMKDESCGQCVPCRVGTVRQVEILERLQAARASVFAEAPSGGTSAPRPLAGASRDSASSAAHDLTLLTELGQAMRDASICGLGQTASSAVESAIARLKIFNRLGGRA